MNISWDLIRTFRSVAKTGSLSASAKELGLTQPTIGRHIDLLEETTKLTLFIRSREGMAITDQGSDLVASSEDMAKAAYEFERRASGFDENVEGLVRISANEIFGVLILPRILPKFAKQHPDIEIELVDRFGLIPEPLKHLLRISRIKLQTLQMGIIKIELSDQGGKIIFNTKPNVDGLKIIQLIQAQPESYRFDGKQTLRITSQHVELEARFREVESLLKNLMNH